VGENYHDVDAIHAADFLVTYTCNLIPSLEEQTALQDFVASGKRWFALHGTNSILKFLADGRVDSPATAPLLMQTLGTQFIAHPPIQPFRVRIADAAHSLVTGIEEFDTDDELICAASTASCTRCWKRVTGKAAGSSKTVGRTTLPARVLPLVGTGEGCT
jgi:type 1 glutamine amidotransferase